MAQPRTLPRLRRLKGPRGRKGSLGKPRTPRAEKMEETTLSRWADLLGSTTEAKRYYRMLLQFPNASLPELMTMNWLDRNNIPYLFQVPVLGGKQVRGGTVVDFLVIDGGKANAWAVQGEYWHSRRATEERDRVIFERLLGQIINGFKVTSVVQLWEEDRYRRRPTVFYRALSGMSSR